MCGKCSFCDKEEEEITSFYHIRICDECFYDLKREFYKESD